MSINHLLAVTGRDLFLKSQNHCEYFQNLEQRLLEQSQKLTSFMGKSMTNDKSKAKLKLALSPSRDFHPQKEHSSFNHRTITAQPSLNDTPYLLRVKQLCQNIRKTKTHNQDTFQSPNKTGRQREENVPCLAYNINNFGKEERRERKPEEGKEQEMTQKSECDVRVEHSDKIRRLQKLISDSKSLKDTISTESCKSLKSLDQISTTSISPERVKLDDFQILKYLAEGKFGSVYLARHKITNFLFALKRITNLKMQHDPKLLTQRIRQIKIQSYLDHPNIVQLYAVFVEDGDLYLQMELCYSGTLYNSLRAEGRFSEDRIRTIVKQVCYAVEFMHDNDILHRDLKPQNILFHQSIAKICDFGWSVNSPLLRDTLCGTPLYSCPELVQKRQYDNKVDIWNIGVLTYELLYGKVPFEVRTEEDLSKIIDDEIYFPRSKPASLQIKDFILRCLSKKPKERFSIGKLMDHQFVDQGKFN